MKREADGRIVSIRRNFAVIDKTQSVFTTGILLKLMILRYWMVVLRLNKFSNNSDNGEV